LTIVHLPDSKIKEAVLHHEPEIRQRAVHFFAKSFSSDTSVMPLVIKAVETFGKEDAYHLIGLSRDLPQTEDTIDWIIDELNDESCGRYENYAYNLSMVLVGADPTLLLPKESDILQARHFLAELREPLTERLQMLSWDETICWRKLEEFCEEGKDKKYANEINLGHANRIVEALARYGQECEEKVHAFLRQKIEDFNHNPMAWMEPLIVRLAGQAQRESTIPLIVAKLHEDADLVNEACAEALTRIGTPAVLHAIAEAFTTAEKHFRIYAINPLENIHSDLAVQKCAHLLAQEKDYSIRSQLAEALLGQFADEGIEAARQQLIGRELDFEGIGLRNSLLETCTLMGERFPEYEEWMATEKSEKAEHWKKVKELEGDPAGLVLFALEKLMGKKAAVMLTAERILPPASGFTLSQKTASKQKVGRNDPCPCGSGKKFKNCCLRL
jgi:hypothetical protein